MVSVSNPVLRVLDCRNRQPASPLGSPCYFYNYSTWRGRTGIHLEDLFVLPRFRGQGIGKALLSRVAARAAERGCVRLQWDVLDWNQTAIDFYQSLGREVFSDEWRIMRVNGRSHPLARRSWPRNQPS